MKKPAEKQTEQSITTNDPASAMPDKAVEILAGEIRLRGGEEVGGGAAFLHAALGEEDHPVGHVAGEGDFVGGEDDLLAVVGEFADDIADFAGHDEVEGGGGLAEEGCIPCTTRRVRGRGTSPDPPGGDE